MSANHNRIKVADLEKNQPNKVLTTNHIGELEFSDISNIKTDSYNGLDYTNEGKVLDARQGKILKDMIDTINIQPTSLINDLTTGGNSNALTAEMGKTLEDTKLTATIATDAETQTEVTSIEDKKVVSRLKLFNWWQWVKSQTQTISGIWNFTNKVTLASGTTTSPSLIIPNGNLTVYPENGAIERDLDGNLFSTSANEGRNKIITEKNAITLMTKFSTGKSDATRVVSSQSERVVKSLPAGFFSSKMFGKLNISVEYSFDYPYTGVQPTSVKLEYFLRYVNGFYSTSVWGSDNLGQLLLIKSTNLLGPLSMNTSYTEELSTTLRTNYNNNGDNGNQCGIGIGNVFYNTRKSDNSNNELSKNCQFDIVERVTWQYSDANNINANNAYRRVIAGINAFYIEKIM